LEWSFGFRTRPFLFLSQLNRFRHPPFPCVSGFSFPSNEACSPTLSASRTLQVFPRTQGSSLPLHRLPILVRSATCSEPPPLSAWLLHLICPCFRSCCSALILPDVSLATAPSPPSVLDQFSCFESVPRSWAFIMTSQLCIPRRAASPSPYLSRWVSLQPRPAPRHTFCSCCGP